MNAVRNLALLAVAALCLSGCGIFGGDDDEEELQPKPLQDIEQTLPVERVWSANLGGGSEFLRLALSPDGNPQRVFAASHDGVVRAFDPATGDTVWETELDVPLSAGPGFGGDRVAVTTGSGFVICLRADSGAEVWRADVAGVSLARPLITEDSVIVYTIDGKLHVLSRFNGSERWTLEQHLPSLTLRGASAPVVVGTTVINGFDNGRVVASSLLNGETLWEAVLSPPVGRSDLERLADIDGTMAVVGQDLYASGYQGRMAAIAAESGQVLWSREIGTYAGLGADENNVYTVEDSGELMALTRENGVELWRQDALLRRRPTAPVPFDGTVVVGDFEGYVHFFDSTDGLPVARVQVDGSALSGVPVVIGGKLYVQSQTGRLEVFEIERPDPEAPGEET